MGSWICMVLLVGVRYRVDVVQYRLDVAVVVFAAVSTRILGG